MSLAVNKFSVEITGSLEAAQAIGDFPGRVAQIQQRAIATMRRKMLTEAKRDIGREYKLSLGRIAKDLSSKNTEDGVVLVGHWRPVNAIEFGARWTRTKRGRGKGARYTFFRGAGVRVRPGSFIATGINGARLVFSRQTNTPKHRVLRGYNAGKMKQSLRGRYGPNVADMLKKGERPQRLADFAVGILGQEIDRQLGRRRP